MKYNVMGFYQPRAVELGLCSDDLLVLRWFVDYAGTDKMRTLIIDNSIYYWVNYDTVLKELPILKIKKQTLYKKHFMNLCNANVLIHKQVKEGGNFSYYCYGINYQTLLYLQDKDTPLVKNNDLAYKYTEGVYKDTEPCVQTYQTLAYEHTEQILNHSNIILQDNKKESEKEKRHKYGKYGWFLLTDEEITRLNNEFGKEYIDQVIDILDEEVQSTGNKNKYKDWNLVIRKAIRYNWSCLKGIKIKPQSQKTDDYVNVDISYIGKYGETVFDSYPRKKGQTEWTEEDKERILKEKGGKKWLH